VLDNSVPSQLSFSSLKRLLDIIVPTIPFLLGPTSSGDLSESVVARPKVYRPSDVMPRTKIFNYNTTMICSCQRPAAGSNAPSYHHAWYIHGRPYIIDTHTHCTCTGLMTIMLDTIARSHYFTGGGQRKQAHFFAGWLGVYSKSS
jgi:hypothetical protein